MVTGIRNDKTGIAYDKTRHRMSCYWQTANGKTLVMPTALRMSVKSASITALAQATAHELTSLEVYSP